ncbi:hypothetical protein ISCGN_029112 [Ixodes scapularis]
MTSRACAVGRGGRGVRRKPSEAVESPLSLTRGRCCWSRRRRPWPRKPRPPESATSWWTWVDMSSSSSRPPIAASASTAPQRTEQTSR